MFLRSLLVLCLSFGMVQGVCQQAEQTYDHPVIETVVIPLSSEDVVEPCHYSLDIRQTRGAVSLVWIIFDRGKDVHDLSSDPAVLAFARRFNVALLLQSHCPGKLESDRGDMNMNPMEGLGPALLRALAQFAKQTAHPELTSARFIFLGFSGTGPLSARLVQEFAPRTIAAVLTAPGHFEPQGIDTVDLDTAAQEVPEMIVANGADERAGTARPYAYFTKYRQHGAPWTFVLQNHSPHCCTANVKDLMLAWLSAVISERLTTKKAEPLRKVNQAHTLLGSFRMIPAETKDAFGLGTCNATDATVFSRDGRPSQEIQTASWLPTEAVAQTWSAFMRQQSHPVLPLR